MQQAEHKIQNVQIQKFVFSCILPCWFNLQCVAAVGASEHKYTVFACLYVCVSVLGCMNGRPEVGISVVQYSEVCSSFTPAALLMWYSHLSIYILQCYNA